MSIFKDYSTYYDLLYKDKDYAGEVRFVHETIARHRSDARTVLNLGCGTGSHDLPLSGHGYTVTGVDMSPEMIAIARSKQGAGVSRGTAASQGSGALKGAAASGAAASSGRADSTGSASGHADFEVGDARTFRAGKKFDVVISLFHVMSYQVTNADLNAAFATAATHLDSGGIFVFDCWYGPGVLTDPPVVRHKILENDQLRIHRIARPQLHPDDNYVDVNYTILVNNKKQSSFYEIEETHKMRYLFRPEVDLLSESHGFTAEYLPGNIFSNGWLALFVCTKR
jgi:SAM-dependent methyltransferase